MNKHICVSVAIDSDCQVKARLCPIVTYSKNGKTGTFINTNESVWFDGAQAKDLQVGMIKEVSYKLN